jgi:hypothetical protein
MLSLSDLDPHRLEELQKKDCIKIIIKSPKDYCRGAYNNTTGVLLSKDRYSSRIRIDKDFYEDLEHRGFVSDPRIPNDYIFLLFDYHQNFLLKNE